MKIKKIDISIVLIFFALLGGALSVMLVSPVYATEAAVQTNGEIVFAEKSTSSSSEEPIKKPVGKFPSTGELVIKSLSICGAAVLICALSFYLVKRKKSYVGKDGESQ